MTVLPVIDRELRAEGRKSFTYWLRVLSASTLLVVFTGMMIGAEDDAAAVGARLFGNLNTALFIAIWLIVPLLTADCLSRERREGTLGILFLTPLTARAIVIGKGFTHSLRALTMVLAALPVLAIPLLLGGVTWQEGLMALLLDLSSVLLALAAGLVASAYCRQWNRALFLAEVLAAIFLLGFGVLLSLVVGVQAAPYVPGFAWPGAWQETSLGEVILTGALLCTDISGMWSEAIKSLPLAATRAWLIGVCEMFLVAMMLLGLAVFWVAGRVERSRRAEPPTARQLRWEHLLFAPRFWKSLFRSKMRRTLERNPIGWLQQYSTAARMTQWGWCLFVVIAECVLVAGGTWYDLEWTQYWLSLLLALGLAASSASSFRRERESGALELILVTPLSIPQVIFGRLRGLWRQFLPALGLLLAVLTFLIQIGQHDLWYGRQGTEFEAGLGVAILIACTFATLPVVGLYFSLALKHFLAAWLSTLAVGILVPMLSPLLLALPAIAGLANSSFWPRIHSFADLLVLTSAFQIVFALVAFTRLEQRLLRRAFALGS